jgi:hypothetical protein
MCGIEQSGQLTGLITRRSSVQIRLPHPFYGTLSVPFFLSMFTILYFVMACAQHSTDWVQQFEAEPQQTIINIRKIESIIEREMILLTIVGEYPEKAKSICPEIKSKVALSKCKRFSSRPHLWSVDLEEQIFWNGGLLSERLALPRSFEVVISTGYIDSCSGNAVCNQIKAEETVFVDWQEGAFNCSKIKQKRARLDCNFHLSESLPVHIDNYEPAVRLCALSENYSAECHNHLLLRFASSFWTRQDWHLQLIEKFSEVWSEPKYVEQITDAYLSIVAFRVIGMMMPLQVAEFKKWKDEFKPYLHSAIALRVWDEEDPILSAKRAIRGESLRVSKARGPNAPRYKPRPLWKTLSSNRKWIRFCDIRGGYRPVHSDPEIDMIWAVLTSSAMAEPPVLHFWGNIEKTNWEVRWAMAHLLKEVSPESALLQEFKKDPDHRVRRASM